jgi:thiamine-phosphate diphosphorylase
LGAHASRGLSPSIIYNEFVILLPRLYAITDRRLAGCGAEENVSRLLSAGVRLIQLRDKEATARELLDSARSCLALTRHAGALLIVNDRVDVALAAGADGVHLGQDDLSVEDARRLLGPGRIIGISTHSMLQFELALKTPATYVAIGPIFSTETKQAAEAPVGLQLLAAARRAADRPVVAIGGISIERAKSVYEAGADSVAVISGLYPEMTARVACYLRVESKLGQVL